MHLQITPRCLDTLVVVSCLHQRPSCCPPLSSLSPCLPSLGHSFLLSFICLTILAYLPYHISYLIMLPAPLTILPQSLSLSLSTLPASLIMISDSLTNFIASLTISYLPHTLTILPASTHHLTCLIRVSLVTLHQRSFLTF